MKDYSLYIHIPFCKRKCNYCDFHSYPNKEDLIPEYVEALKTEIGYITLTLRRDGELFIGINEYDWDTPEQIWNGGLQRFYSMDTTLEEFMFPELEYGITI